VDGNSGVPGLCRPVFWTIEDHRERIVGLNDSLMPFLLEEPGLNWEFGGSILEISSALNLPVIFHAQVLYKFGRK
jgi:hypothetical protein